MFPRTVSTFAAALIGLGTLAHAADYFIPINLLPFANDRLQTRINAPSGSIVLGGTPFTIEPSGNNIWFANNAGGNNPRTLIVPVNVRGVKQVRTLISTAWGQSGPAAYTRIEIVGTGGAFFAKDLVGNVDVRDWNQFNYTNSINGNSTREVFSSGSSRIDMQTIDLPPQFASQDVLSIRVVDTGNENFSRTYFQGLTVVIEQPDARTWNPAFGGNCHSYNAYQVPDGINWQNANLAAQALGGHLATITSAAENAFIYSLVGGNASFWFTNTSGDGQGPWLGGVQAPGSSEPAGGWGWVTGEDFSYTNWAPGEPNNTNGGTEDRLQFFGKSIPRNSTWNDLPGSFLNKGYLVEFPPCVGDYNGDGGIDGADISAFFADWEAGTGCSDVNDDGGIDGADVDLFFARWSAGGC